MISLIVEKHKDIDITSIQHPQTGNMGRNLNLKPFFQQMYLTQKCIKQ